MLTCTMRFERNRVLYDNVLYIGDSAKDCLEVMCLFTHRLVEIENKHTDWFSGRPAKHRFDTHDRLQHHIYYHFEGGVTVFKFRDADQLPNEILNDCINAAYSVSLEEAYAA